uniref:Uncharacterized protein n=1 Tax=viral metagenome TaxID=1070528 RepID=A0A6M3LKS9_9ZZZZ
MSIELWAEYSGPHELSLTQYFGGAEKGVCVQLTGLNCDNLHGYVGMTKTEARDVAAVLAVWVGEEA